MLSAAWGTMDIRSMRRIENKKSQQGTVIFLMLIFAIPVIALAYVGLVVEPGFKLLQQRILQHQTDTAALSLGWECEQHSDCNPPLLPMTQSAQAQEEECIHPDCFRGMRVVDGG